MYCIFKSKHFLVNFSWLAVHTNSFPGGSFHIKWTRGLNLTPSKNLKKYICFRTSCIRSAGKNSGSCMKYCLRYQLLSIRLTTDQNQDPYSGRVSANCENPADRSTYNMNGIPRVTFCVDCKFAHNMHQPFSVYWLTKS